MTDGGNAGNDEPPSSGHMDGYWSIYPSKSWFSLSIFLSSFCPFVDGYPSPCILSVVVAPDTRPQGHGNWQCRITINPYLYSTTRSVPFPSRFIPA